MALTGLLQLIKGHPEFERHIEEVNLGSSTATISFRTGTKPAYLAALWSVSYTHLRAHET